MPNVTPNDVERIVRREFQEEQFVTVMAILGRYGTEKHHREASRVQLAALKLASGSVDDLQSNIESATRDYRDILAYAEYPEYFKKGFRVAELPAEEQRRIIDSDWRQYDGWLRR
ncbi:MAG: hypothetical protein LAO20_04410 [Acidobacteriia bacterium]|nr:hypothetical protein [Terriglobia bacterium]